MDQVSGASAVPASRFTIIKGAPIPPAIAGRGSAHKYPFATMEVGDAFDAPRDKGRCPNGADRAQANLASAAASWALYRKNGYKFTVRIIDENTIRCWRIA